MDYDIVVVGGSIAGAAFAWAARRAGARVLVVERERTFRDRIRGEGLHPWGVIEARRLGLEERLLERCARPASHWATYVAGALVERRSLLESTRAGAPGFNAHHPELQTTLLDAAEEAGADVRRGVDVTEVEHGGTVRAVLDVGGRTQTIRARLAVVADGRASRWRRALGFDVRSETSPMRVAGLLVEGARPPNDDIQVFLPPGLGAVVLFFPLPGDRARLYYAFHSALSTLPFTGPDDVRPFLERCTEVGLPRAWIDASKPAGPLATFETTCVHAVKPAMAGVALVGDAAGNVDPALGCGLSLALRDARCLSDALGGAPDPTLALDRYATERTAYYRSLLRVETWVRRALYTPGALDPARLARLGRMRELGVDVVGAGPDAPSDDATERALFGAEPA